MTTAQTMTDKIFSKISEDTINNKLTQREWWLVERISMILNRVLIWSPFNTMQLVDRIKDKTLKATIKKHFKSNKYTAWNVDDSLLDCLEIIEIHCIKRPNGKEAA